MAQKKRGGASGGNKKKGNPQSSSGKKDGNQKAQMSTKQRGTPATLIDLPKKSNTDLTGLGTGARPRIAVFYSGSRGEFFRRMEKAAEMDRSNVAIIPYSAVRLDTSPNSKAGLVSLAGAVPDDFDVIFFRLVGKHLEEVDLIINGVTRPEVAIVDPLLREGPPSRSRKAYQMLALARAGLPVPQTLYGPVSYLKSAAPGKFGYPFIVKGSHGDRGETVFLVNNKEDLERLAKDLSGQENNRPGAGDDDNNTNNDNDNNDGSGGPPVGAGKRKGAKKFMAQEFIENDGDFRVVVFGDKVIGATKRTRTREDEFRNNVKLGAQSVEFELPAHLQELAIKAAQACNICVAGVDIALKNNDVHQPVIFEVNSGPAFNGFMGATNIDVPRELVAYLHQVGEKVLETGKGGADAPMFNPLYPLSPLSPQAAAAAAATVAATTLAATSATGGHRPAPAPAGVPAIGEQHARYHQLYDRKPVPLPPQGTISVPVLSETEFRSLAMMNPPQIVDGSNHNSSSGVNNIDPGSSSMSNNTAFSGGYGAGPGGYYEPERDGDESVGFMDPYHHRGGPGGRFNSNRRPGRGRGGPGVGGPGPIGASAAAAAGAGAGGGGGSSNHPPMCTVCGNRPALARLRSRNGDEVVHACPQCCEEMGAGPPPSSGSRGGGRGGGPRGGMGRGRGRGGGRGAGRGGNGGWRFGPQGREMPYRPDDVENGAVANEAEPSALSSCVLQ